MGTNKTEKFDITDPTLIGETAKAKYVFHRIQKMAQSDASVFIYGESGTGKEVVARKIHSASKRKDNVFIPLDCVSIPSTLLESELFGFEKGAFTGATSARPGVFELADKGTLFLDEIVDLDFHLQAKLLRVLQERQFRRIGSNVFIDIDVRIIAATNWIPKEAVKEKHLREDLYYRLNVIPIYLPPLRERIDDIPYLVDHFIKKYNPYGSNDIKGISSDALDLLMKYRWPGNIRELENIVQRMITLSETEILSVGSLPEFILDQQMYDFEDSQSLYEMSFKEAKDHYLKQFEKRFITILIQKCGGNISEAARQAGICRKTIYRILDR